jgi:hypothetical protein
MTEDLPTPLITTEDAVEKLNDLLYEKSWDPEVAHSRADDILLSMVPPEVKAAYEELIEGCRWWAFA